MLKSGHANGVKPFPVVNVMSLSILSKNKKASLSRLYYTLMISDRMPLIPARQVKADAWGYIIMTSCRARTVPGCWYLMQSYCHSPARPALCCLLSDPCTCMHPCFVLGITYSIPEETTEESLYIILLAAPIVRPTPNRSSEDNRPCMHDRNSLYMHVCTLLHLQWPQ